MRLGLTSRLTTERIEAARDVRIRPVIRVFVSSTFSDLKEERNVLQREVFPQREQHCLIRGFQFQAIDLRWGILGEAGLDHRNMQICFDELGDGRRRFAATKLPGASGRSLWLAAPGGRGR